MNRLVDDGILFLFTQTLQKCNYISFNYDNRDRQIINSLPELMVDMYAAVSAAKLSNSVVLTPGNTPVTTYEGKGDDIKVDRW